MKLFLGKEVASVAPLATVPSWITPSQLEPAPAPSLCTPVPPKEDLSSEAPEIPDAACVPAEEPPPGPHPLEVENLHLKETVLELEEEVSKLRVALAQTVASLGRAKHEIYEEAEKELVRLSVAIAGRALGRELAADPGVVVHWAKEATEALAHQDNVTIRIARDLADSVPSDLWGAVLGQGVRIEVDRMLAPSTCALRSPSGQAEVSSLGRIAAVAEALGDLYEP